MLWFHFLSHVSLPLIVFFLNCSMRCSHLNPLYICLAVDIILSIMTILGKNSFLHGRKSNLLEMVTLSTNILSFLISNVNPYYAKNIFVLKVPFATVDIGKKHV